MSQVIAATETFSEALEELSSRDLPAGLPEGAKAVSMWTVFPLAGNPMSEAWNHPDHLVRLKTVVDFAQSYVSDSGNSQEIRLTIELLLQTLRKVSREHPEIIDIENAEVHA